MRFSTTAPRPAKHCFYQRFRQSVSRSGSLFRRSDCPRVCLRLFLYLGLSSLAACQLAPLRATATSSHQQEKAARPSSIEQLTNLTSLPNSAASPGEVKRDASMHRVSVDAASVSLSSLLFLLAREAQLDLVLLSSLDTPVTFRASDLPLRDVLDVLAQQVSFDWRIDGSALRVRDGSLFTESYPVDYIDMDRSTQSRVGLATRVGTLSSSQTSDNASPSVANGSETLIQNQSDHRFWESLADDLEGLLQVDDNTDGMPARFSLNREAGLVTVHARPGVHASVRRYLERLQESVGRQVLIEASVVEVTLSDTYETGIDWQLLANGINGVSAAQVLSGLPAVNSLNNQASVLKVVDNRVYFTVNIERRTGDERDEIVTESEIHTVPVGLVMNVTPQIGRGDRVMLNVRPTLSRILGFVDDPNPELALADVRNSVPEIQVRELESMLSVRSGRVAIIGGLMQNASRSRDRGVAGLASLPFVGCRLDLIRANINYTSL